MSQLTITDWVEFVPASPIGFRRAYIDLPAFAYTGLEWKGASEIVAQYNFSASKNFVLLNLPTKPSGANYGLAIRYRIGETVYRYKLWEDDNFVLNDSPAPLYVSQVIKKNFVLEVWSYNGETDATNTTSVRMITSVRSAPDDPRTVTDYALATGAEFTNLGSETDVLSPVLTDLVKWFKGDSTYITTHMIASAGPFVLRWANQAPGYENEYLEWDMSGTGEMIFTENDTNFGGYAGSVTISKGTGTLTEDVVGNPSTAKILRDTFMVVRLTGYASVVSLLSNLAGDFDISSTGTGMRDFTLDGRLTTVLNTSDTPGFILRLMRLDNGGSNGLGIEVRDLNAGVGYSNSGSYGPYALNASKLYLFQQGLGTVLSGNYAEILGYTRQLTTDEAATVFEYLGSIYSGVNPPDFPEFDDDAAWLDNTP